jgi:signal transduction histidine kinase
MKRVSWITWRIYFVTIPIEIFFLIFAADHRLKSWDEVFTWGAVALFAHTTLIPFIALGVLYSEKIRSWKFDLIFLLLLGSIRGLAINYCVSKFDLIQTVSPAYKIFNSAIALPLWFVGVALLVEAKRQYQRTFRELFTEAMLKEQDTPYRTAIFSKTDWADEALARIQFLALNLSAEMQTLLNRPRDLPDYSIQASKIRHLIDDEIRPTSALLWKKNKVNAPKISIKKLLTISLLENKLRVILAMTISIPYLFVGLNGVYGAKIALFQSVIILSINLSIFGMVEYLYRRKLLLRLHSNLAIYFGSFFIHLIIQLNFIPPNFIMVNDSSTIIYYQLVISVSYFMLLGVINGLEITSAQRNAIIKSLKKSLLEDKFQSAISLGVQAQRHAGLAQYLHGEVQAGLTASSILLKGAADSGDFELAREALDRASGLLNQDLSSISYTRMAPLELKIDKIIKSWDGIAEISVDLPPQDQLKDYVFRNAVQLIEESIANAIRHAKSDVIKISGILRSEVLTITVISNGEMRVKNKAGLGTQLYDELASEWNYASESGHNRLTFTLLNQ